VGVKYTSLLSCTESYNTNARQSVTIKRNNTCQPVDNTVSIEHMLTDWVAEVTDVVMETQMMKMLK